METQKDKYYFDYLLSQHKIYSEEVRLYLGFAAASLVAFTTIIGFMFNISKSDNFLAISIPVVIGLYGSFLFLWFYNILLLNFQIREFEIEICVFSSKKKSPSFIEVRSNEPYLSRREFFTFLLSVVTLVFVVLYSTSLAFGSKKMTNFLTILQIYNETSAFLLTFFAIILVLLCFYTYFYEYKFSKEGSYKIIIYVFTISLFFSLSLNHFFSIENIQNGIQFGASLVNSQLFLYFAWRGFEGYKLKKSKYLVKYKNNVKATIRRCRKNTKIQN